MHFNSSSWIVLSTIEQQIKDKIESRGKPLKEWNVQINYGIKTGYNEAFIIDSEKRKELIDKCPEADSIIRPILRGRDIKSYSINFADQWLINTHNGIKSKNINRIEVENYPIVFEHLQQYKKILINRFDKGDNWTNLRNCAYLEEFEKEKIVWLELTDKPNFALDNKGFYINNTIFFMTGNHLKYLLGFLNSRICEWYFDKIAATSGVGTRRWIKIYIDQLCIPFPDKELEENMNLCVNDMIENPNIDNRKRIENILYTVFNFTEEEVQLIETAQL